MSKTEQALAAFKQSYATHVKNTQWTKDGRNPGIRYAVMGQITEGDIVPPKVVVPASEAYWPGAVYIHYTDIDTKEATQALLHPNSLIPFTDNIAGMTVEVGFPPGLDIPYVRGQAPQTLHETQNVSVYEQRSLQSELITLDRLAPLLLVALSGLIVQVNQGYWRYNQQSLVQGELAIDLTDYVPSTPDKVIWLLLALYPSGDVYIAAGDEFDIADIDTDQTLYIPTSVPHSALLLGWVQLYTGITDLRFEGQVIPVALAPAVYDSIAGMENIAINTYGGFLRWNDGSFVLWEY